VKNDQTVRRYETSGGTTIYKVPVMAFPNHVTNCYLVMDDAVTLLDCGSGWAESNESMAKSLEAIREQFGETATLADVGRIIISHGHIDHFGGLKHVVEASGAKVGVHELDLKTVENMTERMIVVSKDLRVFLDRTGSTPKKVAELMELNKWSKEFYESVPADFTFDHGPLPDSDFTLYHTPGHCPGQVCLQLDDILFSTDHVLSHTTPHQSPESIVRNMGLGHYLHSLRKIREVSGVRLTLGGHEDDMEDFVGRVDATIEFHQKRLDKVLALCETPKTLREISLGLYRKRKAHHVLLALLEAGAHVEYLYERGQLEVVNVAEIEHASNPVLQYHAV
jgi:glyoxylase-like metal-dependent hydrolase (beta-lactamase superfamily II)